MGLSEFATRLKEIRTKLGLTQKEMSEKLGCSRASYAYYETDKNTPDINFIKALHDLPELAKKPELSGISFDYLLGYPVARKAENINAAERYGLTEEALNFLAACHSIQKNNSLTLTVNTLLGDLVESRNVLVAIARYLYYELPEPVSETLKYRYKESTDFIGTHDKFPIDYDAKIDVIDNATVKELSLLEVQQRLKELLESEEKTNRFGG